MKDQCLQFHARRCWDVKLLKDIVGEVNFGSTLYFSQKPIWDVISRLFQRFKVSVGLQ